MVDTARKSISKYFISKGRIDRKTNTKSNIGALAASWTTHQEKVPMSIQILTLEELAELQGELHNYTHRCFLPIKFTNDAGTLITVDVREGDRIYDPDEEITFRVKTIEEMEPAREEYLNGKFHLYEVLLEEINDNRYD